ncbi:hypothetical protein CEW88_11570 [Alloyangia pacifica]|uniref:Uncharacterized protein n=1 Tax=Alloyangia pacifica TaxID=311180 RepID=A0A2U8HGV2_9RHOB|nr:hypothetical protein CEW88_11570 [Alloyangia pacifica]
MVAEACTQHPELREALAILYAEQRDIGAEGDGIAARAVAADAGKTGGRPASPLWPLILQLDASRPAHIKDKTHRAVRVRRALLAMELDGIPSASTIRQGLGKSI